MKALLLTVTLVVPAISAAAQIRQPPPRVILFIGDGFGAGQMALGLAYAQMVEGRTLHYEALMQEGNTGYTLPFSAESPVTDSAAAATQIATGARVLNETVGLSAEGHPIETLVEWAESRGLATGLVTNMRLSHATPASFASHQISRYVPEADIVDDILEREVDVLLGGGARAFVPMGHRVSESLPGVAPVLDGASNRRDGRNRVREAEASGYAVVSGAEELERAAMRSEKLLGLFSASHLPYVLDRRLLELGDVPTLEQMTRAAVEVLARSEAGFFLLVEAGRIDYAGHDNDAGTMLHEILDFDEAIGAGLAFRERHPETLVVVTADHGTGGFSFSYSDGERPVIRPLASGLEYRTDHSYPGRAQLEMLRDQTASYVHMLELAGSEPGALVEVVRRHTGLTMTPLEAARALERDEEGRAFPTEFRHFYGDQESNPACLLGRALARHTHVVWSTGGHTTEPVLTFGRGPGAERLRGVYWNTRVYDVIRNALETVPAN